MNFLLYTTTYGKSGSIQLNRPGFWVPALLGACALLVGAAGAGYLLAEPASGLSTSTNGSDGVQWQAALNEQKQELVQAREREVVVVCRSGNRSALAAYTMQLLGYRKVSSMKTGLRGWNDYELPLINRFRETVDPDTVDELLNAGFCSTLMHPDRRTFQS